ncbi:hypothetical protein PtB15_15B198 [Puccinia triticina]|nr:hypothetical protein PtB15_15B198 [Puccinia triticina]
MDDQSDARIREPDGGRPAGQLLAGARGPVRKLAQLAHPGDHPLLPPRLPRQPADRQAWRWHLQRRPQAAPRPQAWAQAVPQQAPQNQPPCPRPRPARLRFRLLLPHLAPVDHRQALEALPPQARHPHEQLGQALRATPKYIVFPSLPLTPCHPLQQNEKQMQLPM